MEFWHLDERDADEGGGTRRSPEENHPRMNREYSNGFYKHHEDRDGRFQRVLRLRLRTTGLVVVGQEDGERRRSTNGTRTRAEEGGGKPLPGLQKVLILVLIPIAFIEIQINNILRETTSLKRCY